MLSRVQSVISKRGVSVMAAAQARAFSAAIEKVGVVGLGLMGHGIAQVSAQAGFQVLHFYTSLCTPLSISAPLRTSLPLYYSLCLPLSANLLPFVLVIL